jgi:hypothetical protein
MLAKVAVVYDSYTSIVNNIFSSAITRYNSRYDRLKALLTDVGTKYSNTVVPALSTAQKDIGNQLSEEESARTSMEDSLTPMMAQLSTTISRSISTAVSDRVAIRASISANSPSDNIASQLSTKVTVEVNRATSKMTAQSSTLANITAQQSSSIVAAFSSHAIRADASCASQVALATWAPQKLSATNDFATWFAF